MKSQTALVIPLGVLAALGFVLGCGGEGGEHASTLETSRTRIEKLANAMLAYAADNDDALPPAKWVDATEAYVKDPDAYRSPAVGGEAYGFAFNRTLVGKKLTSITDRSQTVLLFDSTELGRNAVTDVSTLPDPPRYGKENTVVYADATVAGTPNKDPFVESSSRLRQIAVALLIYSADHDDRLPLADFWMDALGPYTLPQSFHDPSLAPGQYGFALNKAAAGKKTTEIGPIGTTPVAFTSTSTAKNATAGLDTLPNPGRYGGKNAIVYLDGHVSSEIEKAIEPPANTGKDSRSKPSSK